MVCDTPDGTHVYEHDLNHDVLINPFLGYGSVWRICSQCLKNSPQTCQPQLIFIYERSLLKVSRSRSLNKIAALAKI